MLRLIGIVISIGLADSVNPSTVAPALYLAGGRDARRRVARFALGVFLVSLLGGLAVALGPGELLLNLVPHPRPVVGQWLEVIAGTVLLVVGLLLLQFRRLLSQREVFATRASSGRSAFMLGAGIMAVELPTAFPYFAAIAAVVGSGRGIAVQALLITIYNVFFILPLVGMALVLWIAPERATVLLVRARDLLQRHWVLVLGSVLTLAGIFVIVLGATGVASHLHDGFGHFSRRLHKLIT
ncbi:MAG TPA: GAP family protein [Solirubrobacteraceae bacterium]|nr:GAP family protein [Solirubrobacteraceae bacterium]